MMKPDFSCRPTLGYNKAMITLLQKARGFSSWVWLWLAFGQVVVATLGSLFFSQILKLPPCILCIYQRGLMYPLLIILGVALWKKDERAHFYAFPFVILGAVVATYHNIIYWNLIPELTTACSINVPCLNDGYQIFGFISIPFLSLLAFIITGGFLIIFARKNKPE